MVMGASASTPQERLIGAAALLVASGGVLLLLLMAESVEKVLHRTGIAVLSKLTGLLLAAIAAQVIFTGIQSFLLTEIYPFVTDVPFISISLNFKNSFALYLSLIHI